MSRMSINVDKDVVEGLIELGLDHDSSPIVVKDGLMVANLKVKQSGGASFDLVDDDEEELEDDE